ncbi:MAG: right-handed parallel beta-helix repeat-containing protein, partial [Armatimonadetes bacterium]|nr:right-handed parallel beta-helix repeat-containing protein [Armatimonadota bacterium]
NNVDWCVRGYSHGVYNRGQDSAGILVYEQSNDNVFAYNSVTHGGDGFFLWAGRTTMDTGEGGCNGNLLYGNDFSHAPANGIEATFSRNYFWSNLIMECWHGIWGGYSYDSNVMGNTFAYNAEAIAWEHGQNNQITGNTFIGDRMGINLWTKDSEDPNWGYPKNRDTNGQNFFISVNEFKDIQGPVFRLRKMIDTSIVTNWFTSCGELFRLEADNPGLEFISPQIKASARQELPEGTLREAWTIGSEYKTPPTTMLPSGLLVTGSDSDLEKYLAQFEVSWQPIPNLPGSTVSSLLEGSEPEPIEGGKTPFLPKGSIRGRKFIIIDEWGPYDFLSPKLVWRGKDEDGKLKFDVLGPFGAWTVKTLRGVKSISAEAGSIPGELTLELEPGKASDVLVELEFIGLESIDYRGIITTEGRKISFSYTKFFAPIDWTVKWFAYDSATQDPRENDDWKTIIQGDPLRTERTDRLAYAWGGSPGEGVPGNAFLTLAEGEFEIPEGDYVLDLTSDDGVRVYIDGKLVHDDWTWHGPKSERIPLRLGGTHTIRIEHFELDGYATLKAELKRK